MLTLLWKDYRQNRKLLLGIALICFLPYALGGIALAIESTERGIDGEDAAALFGGAGLYGGGMLVLLASFIAANALAGEKSDRSAEFFAYLPVSRTRAIISRLAIMLSAVTAGLFVNGVLVLALLDFKPNELRDGIIMALSTLVLMVGAGWFGSVILRSPAVAALAAIGTWAVLLIVLALVDSLVHARGVGSDFPVAAYVALSGLIGAVAFVGGTVLAYRQVEP